MGLAQKNSFTMPRLDQLLASLGYGSRRQVASQIEAGAVTCRGEVLTRPEQQVREAAEICWRGRALESPQGLLALLHKPVGYSCTHSSNEGPSIYELLPPQWLRRNPVVTSVGRLDKDTSGALLITDCGSLVQRLTSPRAQIDKIYIADVEGELHSGLIDVFASGQLQLRNEKNPCLPATLEILQPHRARLTLQEGRYHQVRRMFASQGLHVLSLHRQSFAGHSIEHLPAGQWQLLPLPEGHQRIA